MQNYVFVIDAERKPLNPISPARARELLTKQKAVVIRRYPFTIMLKAKIETPTLKPLTLKLDPGSKVTGIAILEGERVIWAANLEHRGQQIKSDLTKRLSIRRTRRSRKTRYRQPRFSNRSRRQGWLAPSLLHRFLSIETWVKRLCKYSPITEIVMELVKFDTQKMQAETIEGVQYQQGTLWGYQVREYLLEKWGRCCAYCNSSGVPLQIDHIKPKSKGGSDRISNLTLACERCNLAKGNKPVEDFLKKDSARLRKIRSMALQPLKDAAAVNSTRWALYSTLKALLPIKSSSGAQTKYNRLRFGLVKEHWIDASCTGDLNHIIFSTQQPLVIKASGWGKREMVTKNKYGFPVLNNEGNQALKTRSPVQYGFRTGDIVRANVPKGKHQGVHLGRVSVRESGAFDVTTPLGKLQSIRHKHCQPIHRKDGYSYSFHPMSTIVQ